MASKKRFSYHWQLFLSVLTLTWVAMGSLCWYFYDREKSAKQTLFKDHLQLICDRILIAYQEDEDVLKFINFTDQYFDQTQFSDTQVYVYDTETGKQLYNIGTPTLQDHSDAAPLSELKEAERTGVFESLTKTNDEYNHRVLRLSQDGKILVKATVPFNVPFKDIFGRWIWTLFLLIVVASLLLYFFTLHLSRTVTNLRNFALKAAEGDVIDYNEDKFPHNELGDISRQIVKIYKDKEKSIIRGENEHKVAIKAIEEKVRIKRQLTNNINHELKTPIGIIGGYLETILQNPDLDEATRTRFLKRSYENVERLRNLLEDVGSITRLEEGATNIPISEVDFHDLVFTIEHDLRISGVAGNMKFNYDLPLNCNVKGNAGLLIGFISNLIKNAAQYSHGTEMGLKMIIESEKHYTFSFYDNGVGVDPEHLPHLFERFYRIDSGRSRKSGGTGLGLPIVKNTIESLGGTISVHNRTEGGLEFLFTLEKWAPNN